jgi:hypothetical protein
MAIQDEDNKKAPSISGGALVDAHSVKCASPYAPPKANMEERIMGMSD